MIDSKDTPAPTTTATEKALRRKRVQKEFLHVINASETPLNTTVENTNVTRSNEATNEDEQASVRIVGEQLLHFTGVDNPTKQNIVRDVRRRKRKGNPTPQESKLDIAEKDPGPSSHRFYARIVPAEEIPSIEINEETDPFEIHITRDDTITFNGKEVTLENDDLLVFNAFLMLRDKSEITASDIRNLGFRWDDSPEGAAALSLAIERVQAQLQDNTNPETKELITKHSAGNDAYYTVNPAVVMTDFVREGSTIRVKFLDDEEDDEQTFRIPNRYKPHDPKSGIKLLDQSVPLFKNLVGARLGEEVDYTTPIGQTDKLQVIAIE